MRPTQGAGRLRFAYMNSLVWFALLLIIIWVVARVFLAVTGAFLHLLWIVAVILFLVWAFTKITR